MGRLSLSQLLDCYGTHNRVSGMRGGAFTRQCSEEGAQGPGVSWSEEVVRLAREVASSPRPGAVLLRQDGVAEGVFGEWTRSEEVRIDGVDYSRYLNMVFFSAEERAEHELRDDWVGVFVPVREEGDR